MASSYSSRLRLTRPTTGDLSGAWGDTVNTGVTDLADDAIAGRSVVTMTDADYTLTTVNGATDEARQMFLSITGTLTVARNVICPAVSKLYFITNNTTGGFAITFKTAGGTGVSIASGRALILMCDGTNVLSPLTLDKTTVGLSTITTDIAASTRANILATTALAPTTADIFPFLDNENASALQYVSLAGLSTALGVVTAPAMTDISNASATITWNTSTAPYAKILLDGNKTFAAPTGLAVGWKYLVITNGSTARTITWNAAFKMPGRSGGFPPDLGAANEVTVLAGFYDGTNFWVGYTPY
jgi:hypothetical protein